uniref:NAD(+) hydrolase SARM1 n=1 Tax=Equus asinus asinus TaxID=83772 RepID=A0A8C4LQ70_EQUAS
MGPIRLLHRRPQFPPLASCALGPRAEDRSPSLNLTPLPGATGRWRPASAAHGGGTPDRPGHEVGHHPQEVWSLLPAPCPRGLTKCPLRHQPVPDRDLSVLSSPGCRFFRELTELKTFASYATCDRSNLADWLGSLDPRFRQYTYGLVSCGLDRSLLHRVSEQQLLEDCGIRLGVHRARILSAAREMLHSPLPCSGCKPGGDTPDVFISYRRNSGSQLASLLKVHLQLHGFNVFIDVEKLEAGKFEDKLIQSVMGARNFVLVLSAGALDKCMQDHDCKDWVHKVGAVLCSPSIGLWPRGQGPLPILSRLHTPATSMAQVEVRSHSSNCKRTLASHLGSRSLRFLIYKMGITYLSYSPCRIVVRVRDG